MRLFGYFDTYIDLLRGEATTVFCFMEVYRECYGNH